MAKIMDNISLAEAALRDIMIEYLRETNQWGYALEAGGEDLEEMLGRVVNEAYARSVSLQKEG